MKYLVDVNVLLAVLIIRHQHHARAEAWIAGLTTQDEVLLCAWTEIAFIRISMNTGDIPDVETGKKLVAGFKTGAAGVGFAVDGARASALPAWAHTPAHLGDGHLASLATAVGAKLATFDSNIPGAALIA